MMMRESIRGVALAALPMGLVLTVAWASPQESVPETGRGAIEGYVFQDSDANGMLAPDEYVLAAVPVKLQGDDFELTLLTDADGAFHFGALAPGTYTVTVAPGPTWSIVGIESYSALRLGEEVLTGVSFGLEPAEAPEPELADLPLAAGAQDGTEVSGAPTEQGDGAGQPREEAAQATRQPERAAEEPSEASDERATGGDQAAQPSGPEDEGIGASMAGAIQKAASGALEQAVVDVVELISEPQTTADGSSDKVIPEGFAHTANATARDAKGAPADDVAAPAGDSVAAPDADSRGAHAASGAAGDDETLVVPDAYAPAPPTLPQTGAAPMGTRGLLALAIAALTIVGAAGMTLERRR